MEQHHHERSTFSGKLGFVLSAAGASVGLGNIWRFPYLAAKYGGGTFLLVYLILAVTFGFSLMIAEIAIGRKTGLSAIGAFKALDKRFGAVGYLAAIIPIIIFPYYSVIGGWVIKYLVTFCSGGGMAAANDNYFGTFAAGTAEPLIYFFIFIAFTALVVWFGVEKGIEKVSKVMMPILVVLTIFIAIYGLTIDGAKDGLIYYIKPRLSDFTFKTVIAAMGQLFYSMSLAMGIMITYGSYMKKENNLESSVRQIEIFDTAIAFLAGLTIIPAVFAFSGGDKAALGKGPSLMFVTLPKVFDSMPFGSVIGTVFFVLVLFAALTSAISLMETIVSIFSDKLGWSRHKATLIVFICAVAIGVLPCLGFGVLDFIHIGAMTILDIMDFVSNSILMPICALFTCILIGFVVKPKAVIDEATRNGEKFKSRNLFVVVIKWVSPICLVLILISSILDALGIFTI